MASKEKIAITRQRAYESLRESTKQLAAQFDIMPPALDIHKRYGLEYRQAMELQRIADFLHALVAQTAEPASDKRIEALNTLVSQREWTKAQVIALVKGASDGN